MPLPRAAALLLLLLLAVPALSADLSPVDLIPGSAVIEGSLTISPDDAGMSWLVGRLKRHLLSRYSGEQGVEDFTFLDVDELAFGVLPRESGAHDSLLVARLVDRGEPIRIKAGDHDIRINIRDKETSRKLKRSVLVALLELLVEKGSESSGTVASPRGDIRIDIKASSYAFFGENVAVGSSGEAVSAAGGAFARKEERISSSPRYGDIRERLSALPHDLVVFVDNVGDDFKKYIALCRAEWGPVLLSMAESADYLGVGGDIIDGDSMGARIVAHSPDEARAKTTQAAAEAGLGLFLRKYLGEGIEQTVRIGRDGPYVTIDVTVRGLSAYWDRLLEVKEKEGDG